MNHMVQIKEFYQSLSEEEKKDLCAAIAEDIFFLDEEIQREVLRLIYEAEPEISEKIMEINRFTMR